MRPWASSGPASSSYAFTDLKDSRKCNLSEEIPALELPGRIALLNQIKVCGKEKNLSKARRLHSKILQNDLIMKDVYVTTALVATYSKCGSLNRARELFDQLRVPNVVSWTTLIDAYTQHGLGKEAIECFKKMQNEGVNPNMVTYICVLKACGIVKCVEVGEIIDVMVRNQGLLHTDVSLGNTMVDMYMKCGKFEKARGLFDELPMRDVVSWNALIAGYVDHRLGKEALECFKEMKDEGVCPTGVTYSCVLKACGITQCIDIGECIDADVRKQGLLKKDIVLGNALIDMYAKCGLLEKARETFNSISMRDVVSWNALIGGYSRNGFGYEALTCFREMQDEGVRPNAVTYICALKACVFVRSLDIGKDIDGKVRKQGLLQKDVVLSTALLDMYAKCGALEKAKEVFEKIPVQNSISWTAMIDAYVHSGQGHEALKCFKQMQDEGILPTAVTYICVLKACGILGYLELGKDIDGEVRRRGLLLKDIVLTTTLIDMYTKCGALEKARELFDQLPMRTVVSWNALMGGYIQHGHHEEALTCFRHMQDGEISPNAVTYMTILKACSSLGASKIGKDIDMKIRKKGLLKKDVVLGNTLIDMYAKCGMLKKAREIFEQLLVRDVVSWNAMIIGYAQLGDAHMVSKLFRKMSIKGFRPNPVTFLALLTVCSHRGLLKEGEKLFNDMCIVFHLVPTLEHYTCLMDLFCRAGHFDKAKFFLGKVDSSHCLSLLLVFMGACAKWGNVNLGRWAFEQSLQLDEMCGAAYICMENIYARACMERETPNIEYVTEK